MNRSHERYACPRCGSLHTNSMGVSTKQNQKTRHRCRDCKKTWTPGGVPKGGDRRSSAYRRQEPEKVRAPKRKSPFAERRKINRREFQLLKIFSNQKNHVEAWNAAKEYRKKIAGFYANANVIAGYDKNNAHTGHYAVYIRPKD